jgi:hypothetical protein
VLSLQEDTTPHLHNRQRGSSQGGLSGLSGSTRTRTRTCRTSSSPGYTETARTSTPGSTIHISLPDIILAIDIILANRDHRHTILKGLAFAIRSANMVAGSDREMYLVGAGTTSSPGTGCGAARGARHRWLACPCSRT